MAVDIVKHKFKNKELSIQVVCCKFFACKTQVHTLVLVQITAAIPSKCSRVVFSCRPFACSFEVRLSRHNYDKIKHSKHNFLRLWKLINVTVKIY
jgi:hypothetical protein